MTGEPRRSSGFDPRRLRAPDWLAGAAGLVLLLDLFAVRWYGNGDGSVSGWTALTILRWLLVLGGVAGVGLLVAQARCRAPAVPITVTVLTSLIALICLIAVVIRTLDPPGSLELRAGALIGLVATAALLIGGVQSMRQEGILDRDGPGEIPTLSI